MVVAIMVFLHCPTVVIIPVSWLRLQKFKITNTNSQTRQNYL